MYHFSIALDNIDQERHGIQNIELVDGCFGAPLWQMSGNQIEDLRNLLIKSLTRIVLYTVELPVSEYESYIKLIRNAHLVRVENIKLAYPAIAGVDDESIRRVIAVADAFSIKILFEPEAEHMEETGIERYVRLRSDATGLIYNPNEFVKLQKRPFHDVLYKSKYKYDIRFLRVCDMVYDTYAPMLPEHGNAQIKECASNMITWSFDGYFSFAPYGNATNGKDIAVADAIEVFTYALCLM